MLKMIDLFSSFGEIYFSISNPMLLKVGINIKSTSNLAVIHGLQLVLFDGRIKKN